MEYIEYTYQCCRCGEICCYEELKEQEANDIEFVCISCWSELTGETSEFHWQFVAQ